MWGCAAILVFVGATVNYLTFRIYCPAMDSAIVLTTNFTVVILSAMGLFGGLHSLCSAPFSRRRRMIWGPDENESQPVTPVDR